MKRFFKLFVLTQPEQRLVIIVTVSLLVFAWLKHHRDLQTTLPPPPAPSASPAPQGAAV